MNKNPANDLKDSMWDFLKDRHQKANIQGLKDGVYSLIQMVTQKDGGQREAGKNIPFDLLDMIKWQIICEAVALVLSGKLDELGDESDDSTRASGTQTVGLLAGR